MDGTSIGTVYGLLQMQDLGFSTTLQSAGLQLSSFSDRAGGVFDSVASSLSRAGASISGGIKNIGMEVGNIATSLVSMQGAMGGLAVGALVDDFLDATGALSDLNEQTGISVRDLQRLSYAGALVGVSMEQIAQGVTQFQNRITEGNSDAVAAINRIGLSVSALQAMSPGEQFEAISAAIATIPDPALRTSTAMDLMGRSGAKMLPLLRSDLKGLGDEAERLGAVMGEDVVRGGDAMGDMWTRMKAIGSGLVAQALTPIAEMFNRLPTEMERAHNWLETMHLDLTRARDDVQDLSRWWDALNGKMGAAPKVAVPSSVTDAFKGGIVAPELPKGDELRAYYNEMARGIEVQKKAFQASDQHAAAIKRLRDELSGNGAIRAARELLEAMSGTLPVQNMTRDAQDHVNAAMSDALDAYKALGRTAPKAVSDTYFATYDLQKALDKLKVTGLESIKGLGTSFRADLMPAIVPLIPVIDGLWPGVKHLGEQVKIEMPTIVRHTQDWRDELSNTGRAISDIGRVVPGVFGAIVSEIGNAVSATGELMRAQEAYNQKSKHSAQETAGYYIQAGTTVLGYYQMAMGIVEKLSDDLTDSMARTEIASRGGRNAVRTAGATAGLGPTAGGVLSTTSASEFTRDIRLFDEAVANSNARLQRYGLTWRDLGADIRQANIDGLTRQLVEDRNAFRSLGVTFDQSALLMKGGLSQLVVEAVTTGQRIPSALQPMLTTLIKSGQLSEDAARALLGMSRAAVPAFKDVQEAAGRYGIEIDKLGPKVNQIRINDIAQQIVADWTLLQSAGADTNTVLLGMRSSVQGVVSSALTAGLTIPEGMRPVIQAMANAGLLTDQFGGKLTDLSGLNFEVPLSQSIDNLVSALNRLVDTFSTVGTAAEEGFGRAARASDQVIGPAVPRGSIQATPEGMPEASVGRPEYHSVGGYVGNVIPFPGRPQGTDTVPVWATPGELYVNAPQQQNLENALKGATARANSRNGVSQTIVFQIGRKEVARMVAEDMPEFLRLVGA